MAKVNILIKLFPEDPSKGFEQTLKEIKEKSKVLGYEFKDSKEEYVAFGIKNLYVLISVDEEQSSLEQIEKEFSSLNNVSSIEFVRVSRT